MSKIKDRIILGIVAGLLANIPKAIGNELLYRNGMEKRRYGDIISGLHMPLKQAKTKQGTAFGVVGDFLFSASMGIPLVYLLSFTGRGHAWIKGWLTGVAGFGLFRVLLSTISFSQTNPKDPVTNAIMSGFNSLWGIVAGLIAINLGDERLFKPQTTILSNPDEWSNNQNANKKQHNFCVRNIQKCPPSQPHYLKGNQL